MESESGSESSDDGEADAFSNSSGIDSNTFLATSTAASGSDVKEFGVSLGSTVSLKYWRRGGTAYQFRI